MMGPSKQAFLQRARQGARRVTMWKALEFETTAWPDPVDLWAALGTGAHSYLFETRRDTASGLASLSVIGMGCEERFELGEQELVHIRPGAAPERAACADPLAELAVRRHALRIAADPALPDLACGLFGYFGFETVRMIEPRLRRTERGDSGFALPDACLMIARDTVVLDAAARRIYCIHLAPTAGADAYDRGQAGRDALVARVEAALRLARPGTTPCDGSEPQTQDQLSYGFPEAAFHGAVRRVRDYIAAGDVMQVVLSQRLTRPFEGAPLDLYRALAGDSHAPYRYVIDLGDAHVVGASPEMLFRLHDGTVTSRPMAGTRRRGADAAQDRALEAELLADPKEIAEHMMLVDLARNDLGRVSAPGSVKVDQLLHVERFPNVMHIVSTVTSRLAQGHGAEEVLRATFPAGTLSGASKIRALEIIAELEPCARGIYGGAIGMIDWNGNADLAIAIRTALMTPGQLHMQAGAGIVQESRPDREWQETLEKSQLILAAARRAETHLSPTI